MVSAKHKRLSFSKCTVCKIFLLAGIFIFILLIPISILIFINTRIDNMYILYGMVSVHETGQFDTDGYISTEPYLAYIFNQSPPVMKTDLAGGWNRESRYDDEKKTLENFIPAYGSGPVEDKETYQKIISVLRSAEYEPCEIQADDYEFIDILFRTAKNAEMDRVVLAYRYADRKLYAFWGEKGFLVRADKEFQSFWQEYLAIDKGYYPQTYDDGPDIFWADSYFRAPFTEDDRGIILSDFVMFEPYDGEMNVSVAMERAIEEVKRKIPIAWPRDFFPLYEDAMYEYYSSLHTGEDRVVYDPYTELWRVGVKVCYPRFYKDGEGYVGRGSVYVTMDSRGLTTCIYDRGNVAELSRFFGVFSYRQYKPLVFDIRYELPGKINDCRWIAPREK